MEQEVFCDPYRTNDEKLSDITEDRYSTIDMFRNGRIVIVWFTMRKHKWWLHVEQRERMGKNSL